MIGKLFDRFRENKKAITPEKNSQPIKRPIGDEIFGEGSEFQTGLRRGMQGEYILEKRDPASLSKIPEHKRDEAFWYTYIDSLMLFERYDEALVYVNDALSKYPMNRNLQESKFLIEFKIKKLSMKT